ncbi:MAG: transcription termination/antitermination NusG family protein [Gemmataceae bacterium]
MPILDAEPMVYPESLFDESVDFPGREWLVFHVRPRQEKSLSRELHRWEIPYYLPQIRRSKLTRGRQSHSYIPLFPGYVFLLGTPDERIQALTTKRVVQHLSVPDQEAFRADLEQTAKLIATGLPIVQESKCVPGTRVRVCEGPLRGFIGVVERQGSGQRLVVWIDFIQQGASVTLPQDCVVAFHDF